MVGFLEDGLHSRRVGQQVEQRLASLAQRALHGTDQGHGQRAQPVGLLSGVQLAKVGIHHEHAPEQLGPIDGRLQRTDRANRVGHEGSAALRADHFRREVGELLGPCVEVVHAALNGMCERHGPRQQLLAACTADDLLRRAQRPPVFTTGGTRLARGRVRLAAVARSEKVNRVHAKSGIGKHWEIPSPMVSVYKKAVHEQTSRPCRFFVEALVADLEATPLPQSIRHASWTRGGHGQGRSSGEQYRNQHLRSSNDGGASHGASG